MKKHAIQMHVVLIIFTTLMYISDNISRTDLLLIFILLQLTFKRNYEN